MRLLRWLTGAANAVIESSARNPSIRNDVGFASRIFSKVTYRSRQSLGGSGSCVLPPITAKGSGNPMGCLHALVMICCTSSSSSGLGIVRQPGAQNPGASRHPRHSPGAYRERGRVCHSATQQWERLGPGARPALSLARLRARAQLGTAAMGTCHKTS